MAPALVNRPLMPNNPNEQGRQDRRAEDDPECGSRQIAPCRHPRETAHDELQIAFESGEIGSRLIGLAQRKHVFVWHMHVMPADG